MKENQVFVVECKNYNEESINNAFETIFKLAKKNIFSNYISPGDTVVIKPNWIRENHITRHGDWEYVITHPSVITVVIKWLIKILNGTGKIIIADAPQTDSSFKNILKLMPCKYWQSLCEKQNIELKILDLREEEWTTTRGIITKRKRLSGDPIGSVIFNLGNRSHFFGKAKPPLGYYGADYDSYETTWAHTDNRNLYKLSRSVLEADVIINIPKLKTHKKAGITACLKNAVGVNTYKNWLPHYSIGSTKEGGDQFPEGTRTPALEQKYLCKLKQFWAKHPSWAKYFVPMITIGNKLYNNPECIRSGNWWGNDTLWRTILDINCLLYFGSTDGSIYASKKRRIICIVDGIIAGQGEGPISCEPFYSNLLIAGVNSVSVDAVCAKIMGFDYKKIPSITHAFNKSSFPLVNFGYESIEVLSDIEKFNKRLSDIDAKDVFRFIPPYGWKGHIEL